MKEIIYSIENRKKKFVLTDNEFAEAMACWNCGNNYFCVRLDASLTKFYKWAETPTEDKGFEVLMEMKNGQVKKVFKAEDKYYSSINNPDGSKSKFPLIVKDDSKLIPQEKFYINKKLLT